MYLCALRRLGEILGSSSIFGQSPVFPGLASLLVGLSSEVEGGNYGRDLLLGLFRRGCLYE